MPKIKILQISQTTQKKDGSPIANNKAKVGIKTNDKDGNDVWINGFVPVGSVNWKEGDTVELEVYNDEQWGLQFKTPEGLEPVDRIGELEKRVLRLEQMLNGKDATEDKENPSEAKNELTEQDKQKVLDSIPF